ncbi:MAG: nucleotidyltransferase substrate binding protein [Planctomycetes bacterium]|nr:nucleotidyltransferase substrate binding protein [Planctomycetota bacterium]
MAKNRIESFKLAVIRLEEVLTCPKSTTIRDSAIKRFEICFELSWRSLAEIMRDQGIVCRTPKEAFKSSFKLALIKDDKLWQEMIEDRNSAVHSYDEEFANKLFVKLPQYLSLFKEIVKSC